MWIIIWIFQSLFSAMWMITSKKILENKKVWNNVQTFLSRLNNFLILSIFILFWFFSFKLYIPQADINLYNIALFFLSCSLIYITYSLRRVAYANEKISVLQPFAMLFQIFPIIIGFLFISWERNSFITFLIAIIASIVVILTSIDFKKIKFNKYSLMVLLSSIIKSFQIFIIYYFLTIVRPETLYYLESFVIILISLFLIFLKKETYQFRLLDKKYIKLLILANTLGLVSTILVLKMYISLWIITTSLISLLYLVFVYLLWYIFLKEIPSKKDIFVSVFVIICIFIWMYFKIKLI